MSRSLLLVMCFAAVLFSCNDNEPPIFRTPQEQLEIDLEIIDNYLADNGISAEIDADTGLRYVITAQGTGESPNLSNRIIINYEGRDLESGEVFDEGEEANFLLRQLIAGWQIGIPLIQEGGSITLYIPSGYAYGPNGVPGAIAPNANLIFDVELIEVVQ